MRTILNIVGQYLVISIEENSTGDALHLSLIYWCKLLELVAKEKRVLEKRGVLMDLTILVVGLILGVGIPLRNKAIKKRRENMKEKGNEEK